MKRTRGPTPFGVSLRADRPAARISSQARSSARFIFAVTAWRVIQIVGPRVRYKRLRFPNCAGSRRRSCSAGVSSSGLIGATTCRPFPPVVFRKLFSPRPSSKVFVSSVLSTSSFPRQSLVGIEVHGDAVGMPDGGDRRARGVELDRAVLDGAHHGVERGCVDVRALASST